jgi:putative ABC transport system substrate-binding protein
VLSAINDADIAAAFVSLSAPQSEALIVNTDPFFFARRAQIVALANRHAIPTMYYLREFVDEGGLIGYGASLSDSYRQVGGYTGRILKGEKPTNLPVLQPTKFELVINMTTAKVLGIVVPPTLLALADDVVD